MGTHAKRLTDDEKQAVVNTFQQVKSVMRTVLLFAGRVSGPGVRRVLAERGLYKPKQHKSVKAKPDIVAKVVPWDTLCDRYFASPVGSAIAQETLPVMLQRSRTGNYASVITVDEDE